MQIHRSYACATSILLAAVLTTSGCSSDSGAAYNNRVPVAGDSTPASLAPVGGPSVQLLPWCGECVDAAAATVVIDGEAATLADLKTGEVVVMRGQRALGNRGWWEWIDSRPPVIEQIEVTTLLQGLVESVDTQQMQLVILGQTVQFLRTAIDAQDPVSPIGLGNLSPGDSVRVSGYRSSAGQILATRIDHTDASAPVRILGRLDSGASTFQIGSLEIDVTGAVLEGLPGGPRAGDVVSVSGALTDAGSMLRADRVAAYAPLASLADGTLVSAEGLSGETTEYGLPPRAKVALVDLEFRDSACEYDDGFYFAPDQLWLLEGEAHDDHVDVVCYLGHSPFDQRDYSAVAREVAGPIEAVDIADQSLTILGVTAQLNFATRLGIATENWGPLNWIYDPVTMPEIQLGRYARIAGFAGPSDNTIIAHSIYIEQDAAELFLYGTPTAATPAQVYLDGHQLDISEDVPFLDHRNGTLCSPIAYSDFWSDAPSPMMLVLTEQDGQLRTARGELYDSAGPASLDCP